MALSVYYRLMKTQKKTTRKKWFSNFCCYSVVYEHLHLHTYTIEFAFDSNLKKTTTNAQWLNSFSFHFSSKYMNKKQTGFYLWSAVKFFLYFNFQLFNQTRVPRLPITILDNTWIQWEIEGEKWSSSYKLFGFELEWQLHSMFLENCLQAKFHRRSLFSYITFPLTIWNYQKKKNI